MLEDVFAWKEQRKLTFNLTVQSDKMIFLLEPNEITPPRPQRVTVIDYPDGRLSIRHNGVDLPYRMHYDKIRKVTQAAIVENKRLSEVLAYVAQRQQERDEKRSAKAPRRRGQAERRMFKLN